MESLNEVHAKIFEAEKLLVDCESLPTVAGKYNLKRRIKAELSFLQKLAADPDHLKPNRVKCSNLPYLSSVVQCSFLVKNITGILAPVWFSRRKQPPSSIIVDVVGDHGKTWVKVVARNPLALMCETPEHKRYGRRSLHEQLEDMICCAAQNLYMFSPPKVKVWLKSCTEEFRQYLADIDVEILCESAVADGTLTGVPEGIAELQISNDGTALAVCGVPSKCTDSSCSAEDLLAEVKPDVRPFCSSDENKYPSLKDYFSKMDQYLPFPLLTSNHVLNLDVSSMLAQVSNMTNGHCNVQLKSEILSEQAQRESVSPVRKVFEELFKDRQLVCCSTAFMSFKSIVSCLGGREERKRASEFLKRVTVLPDDPSERSMRLTTSSQVKHRAKIIFGTGDSCKAVTVTANHGFLRAARGQGVTFMCFVHESRALSEMKEMSNN